MPIIRSMHLIKLHFWTYFRSERHSILTSKRKLNWLISGTKYRFIIKKIYPVKNTTFHWSKTAGVFAIQGKLKNY